MRWSPEFLRMYQEDPQKVFKAFSSGFGGDTERLRAAREYLPRLLNGGVGGKGGTDAKDVLEATRLAASFLTERDRKELGDMVRAVRFALLKRLDVGILRTLDAVGPSLPKTLAKIVETVPRELTGELYPRLSAIATECLVRYLFDRVVPKDDDTAVSATER